MMDNPVRAPELLAPAGDFERLEAAVAFGADAVYLAGQTYGMRMSPANFGDDLAHAIDFAHREGVRVYVVCNTLPRNDEMGALPSFVEAVAAAGADALIIADLGVLACAKRHAPYMSVHMSTQMGIVNYEAARMCHDLGADRVVLARELSLDEIAEIRAKTPTALALEAFVHGAMCMSVSGRCTLSNYMAGRDANRGDCAAPCRWRYALVEEKRPGRYYPVAEGDGGAYIFNAMDLCMLPHIPAMARAGISSLKIEGRAKSAYYTAATTHAYRAALDLYARQGDAFTPAPWMHEALHAISHRPYCTGFYFGVPGQETRRGGYIRDWTVAAVVTGHTEGRLLLRQRNRFFEGDEAVCIAPRTEPFVIPIRNLRDGDGNPIGVAPHPDMEATISWPSPVPANAYLRIRSAAPGREEKEEARS